MVIWMPLRVPRIIVLEDGMVSDKTTMIIEMFGHHAEG
jgi:hypothetical protein